MLPEGVWVDDTGKEFKGPKTIEVTALWNACLVRKSKISG